MLGQLTFPTSNNKMHKIEVNVITGEQSIIPLTAKEIEEIQNRPQPHPTLKQQRGLRFSAYSQEADPLFFKYQAGEVSKEEWIVKREEIRAQYPYPEGS